MLIYSVITNINNLFWLFADSASLRQFPVLFSCKYSYSTARRASNFNMNITWEVEGGGEVLGVVISIRLSPMQWQ